MPKLGRRSLLAERRNRTLGPSRRVVPDSDITGTELPQRTGSYGIPNVARVPRGTSYRKKTKNLSKKPLGVPRRSELEPENRDRRVTAFRFNEIAWATRHLLSCMDCLRARNGVARILRANPSPAKRDWGNCLLHAVARYRCGADRCRRRLVAEERQLAC